MVWKQRVTSWEESNAPFTSFQAKCSTPAKSHSHYLCFENDHCWMMSIFKQICFITTSYFLSCVPLWLFYTHLWKHCYVNWSKSGLSDPHTRGPVEWTYEREIKQTVRSLRVIVCLQVCFLYWWGVSCPILSDCVQEACVSCCVMVDQFQDQRKTQELQICSNIFSNWLYRSVSREQLLVLDLMSTGLLLYLAPTSLFPVVSPKLKLPSLPTETLCYRHLQQTHCGANGVTHGVSPNLSSSL